MNGGNLYGHQPNENQPMQNAKFPIPQGQPMFRQQMTNASQLYRQFNPNMINQYHAMYQQNQQQSQAAQPPPIPQTQPVMPTGQQPPQNQQSKKRAKQQPQKHPYPPQQFAFNHQPYLVQQQQPQDIIKGLLSKLPDELADLFFKIYNIPQKKKDQRIAMFIDMITELNQSFPDAAKMISQYQLMKPEAINAFRDPPLPAVFQRTKGTYPSYFICYRTKKDGFEYIPSPREKKQNEMIIGTFFTIQNVPARGKVALIDKDKRREIQPFKFGETFECFVLHSNELMQGKFHILTELAPEVSNILTFFVIQMVTRRSWVDVVSNLSKNDPQFNPALIGDVIPASHSVNGVTCHIDAASIFESACTTYLPICPRCGKQILLKDLSFSLTQDAPPSNPDPLVADFIAQELYYVREDSDDVSDIETLQADQREFNFSGADEYLNSISESIL